MKKIGQGFILGLLAVTGIAFAQTADPGINARQEQQKDRIQQGVRSGELSRGEAATLRTEERGVRAEERAFKSDGKLSGVERRTLKRDLNDTSRDIHRKKHNARVRAPVAVRSQN